MTEPTLILIFIIVAFFFSFKQFFNASSPSSNLGEKFPGMLCSEVLHVHMFSISCLLPFNVLLFYYIITNEIPNHITRIILYLLRKDMIYYVAIATVAFSQVKITCYFHL